MRTVPVLPDDVFGKTINFADAKTLVTLKKVSKNTRILVKSKKSLIYRSNPFYRSILADVASVMITAAHVGFNMTAVATIVPYHGVHYVL